MQRSPRCTTASSRCSSSGSRADALPVFDHTRRSDQPKGLPTRHGARAPADRVHVDYTVASGPKRAADVLGRTRGRTRNLAAGGRIMQINVWRPIRGRCSGAGWHSRMPASVGRPMLIATGPSGSRIGFGEIYQLAHPGKGSAVLGFRRWNGARSCSSRAGQPDNGCARFTPHGAFQLASQDPGARRAEASRSAPTSSTRDDGAPREGRVPAPLPAVPRSPGEPRPGWAGGPRLAPFTQILPMCSAASSRSSASGKAANG